MPKLVYQWVVGALVALLLGGCVPSSMKTSETRLQETLRLYEAMVRWGSLDRIYGFLTPELAESAQIPEGLANIRVTGYDTVAGPSALSETRWAHTAAITYVLQDRQVVKSLVDNQVWEQDEESGSWWRANPIPPFQ
jgi:hypothetical protein